MAKTASAPNPRQSPTKLTAAAAKSAAGDSGSRPKKRRSANDYWRHAREPFPCLLFLLPLLALYELGVYWLGGAHSDLLRNGADYWMRQWLSSLGRGVDFALPVLVVGVLLVWHWAGNFSWKIRTETFVGMSAESLLFAFSLVVLGQLQDVAFRYYGISSPLLVINHGAASRLVSYVGAGIYEEVLFRLGLLPVCYVAFRVMRLDQQAAIILAIIASSLTFSWAHYVGPGSDTFSLFTFAFRTLAGLFFAVLFRVRGFGITVGTHATYDVLVGILLSARY